MRPGGVRAPFDVALGMMRVSGGPPVVSIDIPSGWDVERGDTAGVGVQPAVLVSLTAPKSFAEVHLPAGVRHFLGGRFLPPGMLHTHPFPKFTTGYAQMPFFSCMLLIRPCLAFDPARARVCVCVCVCVCARVHVRAYACVDLSTDMRVLSSFTRARSTPHRACTRVRTRW